MSVKSPNFISSPYFYVDDYGWHLTEDAPEDVREEFDAFVQLYENAEKEGVVI